MHEQRKDDNNTDLIVCGDVECNPGPPHNANVSLLEVSDVEQTFVEIFSVSQTTLVYFTVSNLTSHVYNGFCIGNFAVFGCDF